MLPHGTLSKEHARRLAPYLIIAIVSIALHYIVFIPFPLTWDSACYLDNAEFFLGNEYLYDEIRPPLVPLIISTFFLATRDLYILGIFWILIRIATYIAAFRLVRLASGNENVALFSVLLLILNPITLSVPFFMSDYVSMLFIVLSVTCFMEYAGGNENRIYHSLFFASMAFLSRYYAIFLLPVYGLYIIAFSRHKLKSKPLWISAAMALIPVIVWMLWNLAVYQDPLFSIYRAFAHIQYDAPPDPIYYFIYGPGHNILNMLHVMIIPLAVGLVSLRKSRVHRTLLLWFFLYLFSISFIQHKVSRYLLFLLIPLYFFTIEGAREMATKYARRLKPFMPLIVFAALIPVFFGPVYTQEWIVGGYDEIGTYIKDNTPSDAVIIASPSPQIAFYGKRRTYTLTGDDICEYAECPYWPHSFYKTYGCDDVDYIVLPENLSISCATLIHSESGFYVYSMNN